MAAAATGTTNILLPPIPDNNTAILTTREVSTIGLSALTDVIRIFR